MPTYFIVHKDTRETVRTSNAPFNADESIQPPAPHVQLKRIDNDAVPAFDAATQKIVREFTDNDANGTRTFHFVVTAKNAEEIAAYQKKLADAATLDQIKAIYLAMKNGTGSAAERIVRVEKVCAYLLRDEAASQGLKV